MYVCMYVYIYIIIIFIYVHLRSIYIYISILYRTDCTSFLALAPPWVKWWAGTARHLPFTSKCCWHVIQIPSQVAAGSCRDLPAEAIAKASTWVKFGNHCFLDQSEVFPSNPTTTPRQPNLIMSDELKTIPEKRVSWFFAGYRRPECHTNICNSLPFHGKVIPRISASWQLGNQPVPSLPSTCGLLPWISVLCAGVQVVHGKSLAEHQLPPFTPRPSWTGHSAVTWDASGKGEAILSQPKVINLPSQAPATCGHQWLHYFLRRQRTRHGIDLKSRQLPEAWWSWMICSLYPWSSIG